MVKRGQVNSGLKIFIALMVFFSATAVVRAVEPNDINPLVEGNNDFAFDLYSKLKTEKKNLFFSPYSISSALAIVYAGAKGETAEQMANVLHFPDGNDMPHAGFLELRKRLEKIAGEEKIQLNIANALWPSLGVKIKKELAEMVRAYYQAGVTLVDFSKVQKALNMINGWVSENTLGKIEELLKPEHLKLRGPLDMIVTNAIYFKGRWADQFDPNRTEDCDFYISDKNKVTVKMMNQKADFRYAEIEGAKLLELPYSGGELSMQLILPEVDRIKEIESRLNSGNLRKWSSRLVQREVDVYLPRFEIKWGAELKQPLQALSMKKAFARADFSGMFEEINTGISDVVHKAYFKVNEEGTEVAAATAVIMGRGMSEPKVFRADHPFILLIRENKSASILFMGKIADPTN